MSNFITKTDIAGYIPLAVNLDEQRVALFAHEVEKMKCTELLGRELYTEIKTNPINLNNIELIETVKPVLVYWTYIMYLEQGRVFNTATGPVVKRTDSSIHLTDMEMKMLIDSTAKNARFYESELQFYLSRNGDRFPLWIGRSVHHSGMNSFKIRVL